MKVAHAEKHIVASQGIVSQSGFRIQASAHAYKILSDGLYSDKPTAVLREIGCNANDAHVAQGCPNLPIEVKLPNSLSPDMYIKDFGPGLSDEDVRGLYTTYFSSTKQESNDFTGAFGLGSKSPFSYTDSFTVVSAHAGVERTYTATIDDDGVPMMALMHETPASPEWEHGVLVGFAVPPRDFAEFERKAREVFQWFTVKPNVLGQPVSRFTPHFALDCATFSLRGNGVASEACVIMGNVRYPLDASKLAYLAEDAIGALGLKLLACGIHLRLPIGTVQVAASREQLQYDKLSKPALVEALRAAALEFSSIVTKVAKAPAENEWARHVACQRFIKEFNAELRVVVWEAVLLSAKDLVKANRHKVLFAEMSMPLPKEAGQPHAGRGYKVSGYRQNDKTGSVSRKSIYGGEYYRGDKAEVFHGGFLSGFTIFVNDDKYAEKRMRTLVGHGEVKDSVMISPDDGGTVEETLAYATMLSEQMGGAPLAMISSLPAPQKRPRSPRTPGVRAKVAATKAGVKMVHVGEHVGYAGPTLHPRRLDSVPPSAQYFLVKGSGSGGNSSYLATPGFALNDSCLSMRVPVLAEFLQGLQAINTLSMKAGLEPIAGYLLVTETQVKRLNLEELGYQPLVLAAHQAAMVPAVAQAFEQGTRGLPFMGAQNHTSVVDAVVSTVRGKKSGMAMLQRLLQGNPMAQLLLEDLPKVTGGERQAIRNTVSKLNKCFAHLRLAPIQVSAVEVTSDQVKADFDENYPFVRKIGTVQLVTSLQGNALDEVFLQQVFISPQDIALIQSLKNQQANDRVLLTAAA